MKCANPTCLRDAKLVPRIKRGPLDQFVDQALIATGMSRLAAAQADDVRKLVLREAKRLAYQSYASYSVCNDCVPWARAQFPVATRALQMVPVKRRIVQLNEELPDAT